MSAFKVLNLRTLSSRIILMLAFLSSGLISLVFSAPVSVPLFELAIIISYPFYGEIFFTVSSLKSKNKPKLYFGASLLFFLSLTFNFFCFTLSSYFASLIVSLLAILTILAFLQKLILIKKAAAIKLLPLLILYIVCVIFSFLMLFSRQHLL